MVPQLCVDGVEFFSRQTRTRFPFRYGIASMTEVPHLFVRVSARIDDQRSVGLASEGLPPKWFTKDPNTTFERDLTEMFAVIAHASGLMLAAGKSGRTFHGLWSELYRAQADWALGTRRAPLLANLGVSLCERALLDAVCRSLKTPFHRVVHENLLGLKLGEIHAELGSAEPRDLLAAQPLEAVMVRHTLGLTDPLTARDIAAADRVEDGLPQDLAGCIRAYGLRAFKIKLTGDASRDAARLRALRDLLRNEVRGPLVMTFDANENFQSFAAFREFWRGLTSDPELKDFVSSAAVVEQPVHRSLALHDEVGQVLRDWPDHPPLIIDESDGSLADLPRALALGYAGTSHKNCKGIVKGIANACLLEKRRRSGQTAILTGEDLCTLGPVALLQDLALMALLGVAHVERNGHHYFRGLTPWPEDWQEATRAAHPDLYIRDPAGFVRLNVDHGAINLRSVNAAPLGLAPLMDPSIFARVTL